MAGNVTLTREQHYDWVHVGDLLEERFTLTNNSFLPVVWAEVTTGLTCPLCRSFCTQRQRLPDAGMADRGICRRRGLFTWDRAGAHQRSFRAVPVTSITRDPLDPDLSAGRAPADPALPKGAATEQAGPAAAPWT